jgi:hypothetical protein
MKAARFGSGSAASMSRVTTCAMFELCESILDTLATTSTDSLCLPISSVTSTVSV